VLAGDEREGQGKRVSEKSVFHAINGKFCQVSIRPILHNDERASDLEGSEN
jgi:hypothetical protein